MSQLASLKLTSANAATCSAASSALLLQCTGSADQSCCSSAAGQLTNQDVLYYLLANLVVHSHYCLMRTQHEGPLRCFYRVANCTSETGTSRLPKNCFGTLQASFLCIEIHRKLFDAALLQQTGVINKFRARLLHAKE